MKRIVIALGLTALLSGCGIFGGDKPETPSVGNRTPILFTEGEIEADPQISTVPVVLPAASVNTAWVQPGGNAAKAMGQLALSASPSRAWQVSIGDAGSNRARLGAAPVVANGRIYTVDTRAMVRAFDAQTGSSVWNTRFGTDIDGENAVFGGGVSVSGDRVYVTNGVGYVGALNAETGAVIWKVRPGQPLRGAPTVANDNVYVISQDNQVYALSPDDGEVQWTVAGSLETSGVFGVAAPASAQGTLVTGFSSGELFAYRYENGRVVWQDNLRSNTISTSVSSLSDVDASPVIDDGIVYAIGQGGRMAAIELTSGQRIWEIAAGGLSTPWVAGDWLFVVTDEAKLVCIAKTNGRIRWITQLPRFRDAEDRKGPIFWRGPVLAGGNLVLVSSRGTLTFVDAASGSVGRTENLDEPFNLSPIVANNTLYLLNEDGRLSAWR